MKTNALTNTNLTFGSYEAIMMLVLLYTLVIITKISPKTFSLIIV